MADSKALTELKSFLNKLFQFESQDLDFGIYKILHYKRKEVKGFIDKLLTDKVKEQLQIFDAEQKNIIKQNLQELEADEIIINYNTALGSSPADAEVFYKYNKTKIVHYLQVKREYDAIAKNDNTEETIYNHLTLFFSRYYDKGDFISKRRFGKNEKYVVPYNGEETHFYWANHDQYYIKSSEYFQQFAFKIPQLTGTLTVNFKLADAKTEQGNVKADENKYFVLSEKPAELTDTELHIFFEFRPLTEAEKKSFTGNGKQDTLNERATTAIKELLNKNAATAELWKEDNKQQTLLLKKLNHYTRKNSYDFFIHKDLKGFLQRELDFYIKSELVKVEDLYVLDSEQHFENIRHNFKLIKCFKNIADTIIDFLTQIEEFQKKLWEKKKFVLTTEWVVTIDKLAEWLDTKIFESIIKQVLKNENQAAEWKQLFGWDKLPFALTIEGLKADLHNWYKLPIDTKHFDSVFKEILLNALSEKINIEVESSGLIIHSDNYHGLMILQRRYCSLIQPVYVDPPYNTDASAILYKNNYKDSSFYSLMAERIKLAHQLLYDDGIICVAIDDEEVSGVRNILSQIFCSQVGIVAVRSNPAGRKTKGKFAPAHEYALFFGKSENAIPSSLDITEKRLERYPKKDEKGNFAWANFIRSGNNDKREDRPKLFYPIFVHKSNTIRIPEMSWDDGRGEYNLEEKPTKDEVIVFPILKTLNGIIEKNWQRGHQRVPTELEEYRIRRVENGDISIDFKTRMDEDSLPVTWWDDKKYASANYGAAELKELFGVKPFDFPKAKKLVIDCLKASGAKEDNSIILDFFPGSGTTFNATQILNKEDSGKRKCILIEEGTYIYTVIIPRIKKIAYSFDWKEGKPQNMNGLGVFVKYQRLEQYEEALENIAFTATDKTVQQAMAFNDYIPKYFLELETRGSKTLVNIEAMQNPWGYKLKVWDGFTYDTEQAVDLVETFNYLIGLHVQKYFTRDNKGRKYVFVWGWNNEQKKSLIIWRDITGWKEKDYEKDREYIESNLTEFENDNLYINGQSTLPGYQMIEDIFKTKMIP